MAHTAMLSAAPTPSDLALGLRKLADHFMAAQHAFFKEIRHSYSFSVSGGSLTANVPARGAIAIHMGATGSERQSNSVSVAFSHIAITSFGEVRGIESKIYDSNLTLLFCHRISFSLVASPN
jgi:hypothetical protein